MVRNTSYALEQALVDLLTIGQNGVSLYQAQQRLLMETSPFHHGTYKLPYWVCRIARVMGFGFWVFIFPSLCFIVLKLVENWSLFEQFKNGKCVIYF
jgi:hypothetical protein